MSRRRRSPRRAVVEHGARLDILCCLDPFESVNIAQVCRETGLHLAQVKHHLRILDTFGLVRNESEGGETLYVACLEQSPAWVTRAVDSHRRRAAAK
jgi:hypothetical protein